MILFKKIQLCSLFAMLLGGSLYCADLNEKSVFQKHDQLNHSETLLMPMPEEREEESKKLSEAENKKLREEFCDALERNAPEDAYKVIEKGLDPNAKFPERDNETCLWLAVIYNQSEVVGRLVDAKADINAMIYNDTPLSIASSKNYIDVVEKLLLKKAQVNLPTSDGFLPLQGALEGKYFTIVRALLANKADPNKTNNDGLTPLMIAGRTGTDEIFMRELVENGARINYQCEAGATALMHAIEKNESGALFLMSREADITLETIAHANALAFAAQYGKVKILEAIMNSKHRPAVNQLNMAGQSPLMLASRNGHLECMNLLVNNKANINALDNMGESSLIYANEGGYAGAVRYLVFMKADVNQMSNNQTTALLNAVINNHSTLVQQLLFCNANSQIRITERGDHYGKRAVDYAETGHMRTILENADPVKIERGSLTHNSALDAAGCFLRPSTDCPELQRNFAIELSHEQSKTNIFHLLRNREYGMKKSQKAGQSRVGSWA